VVPALIELTLPRSPDLGNVRRPEFAAFPIQVRAKISARLCWWLIFFQKSMMSPIKVAGADPEAVEPYRRQGRSQDHCHYAMR